jgi:hypothetical protein
MEQVSLTFPIDGKVLTSCPCCYKPIEIKEPKREAFRNLAGTEAMLRIRCYDCGTESYIPLGLGKYVRIESSLSLKSHVLRRLKQLSVKKP